MTSRRATDSFRNSLTRMQINVVLQTRHKTSTAISSNAQPARIGKIVIINAYHPSYCHQSHKLKLILLRAVADCIFIAEKERRS